MLRPYLFENHPRPYLLYDDFSAPLAAGAVNGSLTTHSSNVQAPVVARAVTDTENKLSVADGALILAGGKLSPAYTDPRLNDPAWARVLGRTLLFDINLLATNTFVRVGWATNATAINGDEIILFNNVGFILPIEAATNNTAVATYTSGVTYNVAITLRNAGAIWFIRGGAFADWTLLWVGTANTATPLMPSIFNHSAAGKVRNLKIADLGYLMRSDYEWVTQRVAVPSAGETIASEANHLVEFTWPATTNGSVDLEVRRLDANNSWVIRCDQASSTIKLIERIAGVETERDSKAQTWTDGTNYRIVVRSDGEVIQTYVNSIAKATFTTAANLKAATGVKVTSAGTNLISWPLAFQGVGFPTIPRSITRPTYNLNSRLAPVLAKRAGKWDAYCVREICILIDESGDMVMDGDGKYTSFYWGRASAIGASAIGIAKSLDGITWSDRLDTPVLAAAGAGWYSSQVLAASVIKRTVDGVLMMMCQGNSTMGVFTSPDDGATWVEVGAKITLTDYSISGTPITAAGVPACIKRAAGDYVCLFEGRLTGNVWSIFGATSPDFVGTWTPLNGGLPLLSPTGSGWENTGVANPRLIETSPGNFVMAYNGINTHWQIGLATSTDLLTWTRYSGNPILHNGTDSWESYQTETSFLVKEGFPSKLYYQGYASGDEIQIGLAEFY